MAASTNKPQPGEIYRVREGFAVPGPDGFMRTYTVGALIDGGDKVASSHRALLEPASSAVEQASAAPGERRLLGLRLPSGRTVEDATAHRTGHAHETGAGTPRVPTNLDEQKETDMPHALPPEHPDRPASPHAPFQPGMGVVADDADEKGQNLGGGVKASEAGAKVKAAAKKVAAGKEPGEASGEAHSNDAGAGE